jgi:hypothetical protein
MTKKIISTRGRQQKPEFEEIDVQFDLQDFDGPESSDETEQLEFGFDDWDEDILPITGID